MTEFNVKQQDDFIRALMNHPDNYDNSPQFALGYMSMMLHRAIRRMDADDRESFLHDINWVIDRCKPAKQNRKAAG